jgi:cytoskeletal protein RodZ
MERQQILETRSVYPPEPHFDEERTLLSARRVVPLGELNAKAGSRGWLLLTGGIAFAILLGAGAAVLMVHLEQRRVEPAISVSAQPVNNTQQSENVSAQVDTSDVSSSNETANTLSSEPVTPLKTHPGEKISIAQKTSVSSRRPDAVPTGTGLPASNTANPDTEGPAQAMNDREARAEQRWEEKRLRREASRDRRDNNRDPSADLFRIGEIFEGTRKPD